VHLRAVDCVAPDYVDLDAVRDQGHGQPVGIVRVLAAGEQGGLQSGLGGWRMLWRRRRTLGSRFFFL
jgi:hypothetical protein